MIENVSGLEYLIFIIGFGVCLLWAVAKAVIHMFGKK